MTHSNYNKFQVTLKIVQKAVGSAWERKGTMLCFYNEGNKLNYLLCTKNFGMADGKGSSRKIVLNAGHIENPVLPMTWLSILIFECVHPKPLSSPLMPGSLKTMSIPETVHPKTMHLVTKVFSSIFVPVSAQSHTTETHAKQKLK